MVARAPDRLTRAHPFGPQRRAPGRAGGRQQHGRLLELPAAIRAHDPARDAQPVAVEALHELVPRSSPELRRSRRTFRTPRADRRLRSRLAPPARARAAPSRPRRRAARAGRPGRSPERPSRAGQRAMRPGASRLGPARGEPRGRPRTARPRRRRPARPAPHPPPAQRAWSCLRAPPERLGRGRRCPIGVEHRALRTDGALRGEAVVAAEDGHARLGGPHALRLRPSAQCAWPWYPTCISG